MKIKFDRSATKFSDNYALKDEDYAANGGGFPIRVKGIEGVVGVIVVSGLHQEEDHQLAVNGIREYLERTGLGS